MKYYIAADGGGTKLQAILYDEKFQILNTARMGGTNHSFNSVERIRDQMEQLAEELIPESIAEIEEADICIVGDTDLFLESLGRRCTIKNHRIFGEGHTCLASAGAKFGILAQAGTGSHIFLIQRDGMISVGGWGCMLGDEGSGFDIGMRTLKAAVYSYDGRGPKTPMLDMLMEKWNLSEPLDMVLELIHEANYQSRVASVSRITAEAARQKDPVALRIYEQAGHDISLQVITAIAQNGGLWEGPIVPSGGAWKGHRSMFDTFRADILSRYPDAEILRPVFEPVVGCVIQRCFAEGYSYEELEHMLREAFREFCFQEK